MSTFQVFLCNTKQKNSRWIYGTHLGPMTTHDYNILRGYKRIYLSFASAFPGELLSTTFVQKYNFSGLLIFNWFKYIHEIHHYCPDHIAIILVATKIDLRDDPETIKKLQDKGMTPVTTEEVWISSRLLIYEGFALAQEINAACYVESSSLRGTGIAPCTRNIIY